MKLTAGELKEMRIVEKVFSEPETYTVESMEPVVAEIRRGLEKFLEAYRDMDGEKIARQRYDRFRSM